MPTETDDYDGNPAHWLPEGTSICTPERLAKPDMHRHEYDADGHVRFAQSRVVNILNFLYEIDVIDDQQMFDANTYEIWRGLFRVFTGTGTGTPCYSPTARDKNGSGLREYGYVLVLKRLHRRDQQIMDYAIDAFATQAERTLLMAPLGTAPAKAHACRSQRAYYRNAAASLSTIMQNVRDDLASVKETIAHKGEDYLWECLRARMDSFNGKRAQ